MSSGAAFFIASARALAFYQLALSSDGRLRGLRAGHFPDDRESSGPAALERCAIQPLGERLIRFSNNDLAQSNESTPNPPR